MINVLMRIPLSVFLDNQLSCIRACVPRHVLIVKVGFI